MFWCKERKRWCSVYSCDRTNCEFEESKKVLNKEVKNV